MTRDDSASDAQLVHRARIRAVALLLVVGVMWLALIAVGVVEIVRSLPNYHPGRIRLFTGTGVVLLSAAATCLTSLRLLRVLRRQPPMPATTPAQQLRASDHIRRNVPVEAADTEPARAVATRMATGRLRAGCVVATAPMLVGAAILLPSLLLDAVCVLYAVLLAALAIRLVHTAGRAERFLGTTNTP